ncbi:DNA gyrase subunit A [endosymbiont of Sipalinus gigas]|uniref:DNA gyrase subunit A n=1 Tax=endosymbiont of Sipalinus gigas TaxID=1972134 RepID=UPI000DC73535|nr:DNA gyrase subunit A [endosymbiont of Sipalinus gigas]BBA85289.1 DNA gyrase subunit A [endosymbiont of Sipalinus gigas]
MKNDKFIYLEEELKSSYLNYAMSVIIGRALPDIRDGLKPVHRRILYAMNLLNNYYNKPYKKSARIVGDVIGKYHPHGDITVYDAIVRMAQKFSLRYTLIDGQGNFGSIDGDSAAAMRYTEIRMSKISHELLCDINKDTVNFIKNYDGSEYIPEILPSKIPNLLINGSYGIAVGVATSIPPHNLKEVLNGCLAVIKNSNIETEELLKYIPGPDFPTSAIINSNKNNIIKIYKTGKGKICVRSKVLIEKNEEKEFIIVNEIPYQINKTNLIEKIVELIKLKQIDGISNIYDESDQNGMRIVIELKKDFTSDIVLNNLYSKTQLQTNLSINMVALYKGQPKLFSLKEILVYFIEHRKEVILRKTKYSLNKNLERLHILEGIIVSINNIDYIINLIKNCSSSDEVKNKLINKNFTLNNTYNLDNFDKLKELIPKNIILTETQIKYILDLRLNKLISIEYKKILDEYIDLVDKNNEFNLLLNSNNILLENIKNELIEIKNQYQDNRLTKIIFDDIDIKKSNMIKNEDVVITLSYKGYIKYQSSSYYIAQKRGGKGKLAAKVKEEDFIYKLSVANSHDDILFFSDKGKVYIFKVYNLPRSGKNNIKGKLISNLIPISNDEKITSLFPINNDKISDKKCYIFMSTYNGIVKKTLLNTFNKIRNTGIIAINLSENDKLIDVNLTYGNNDIMLFTLNGMVLRFNENEVKPTGRNTRGVKGIKLSKNDKVVSMIVSDINKNHILTLTKKGFGKRTDKKEYSTKSRFKKGTKSIKITEKNGEVVKSIEVNDNDQVVIVTNSGSLVRINVKEISLIGRNTKGILLIKCKNENVVDLERIL